MIAVKIAPMPLTMAINTEPMAWRMLSKQDTTAPIMADVVLEVVYQGYEVEVDDQSSFAIAEQLKYVLLEEELA